jgi:hypothetical protein
MINSDKTRNSNKYKIEKKFIFISNFKNTYSHPNLQ